MYFPFINRASIYSEVQSVGIQVKSVFDTGMVALQEERNAVNQEVMSSNPRCWMIITVETHNGNHVRQIRQLTSSESTAVCWEGDTAVCWENSNISLKLILYCMVLPALNCCDLTLMNIKRISFYISGFDPMALWWCNDRWNQEMMNRLINLKYYPRTGREMI